MATSSRKLTEADDALLKAIKAGGQAKEQAVSSLIDQYLYYVQNLQSKLGLSEEDAMDAYTDGILVLVNHAERDVFRGDSKLSTYLYRIIYNKGVDLLRKHSTNQSNLTYELPEVKDDSQDLAKQLDIQGELKQLEGYLDQVGEKCKSILLDWGFWGYSMQEIAQRAGLKDAKSAKNRKYKCLERLMRLIEEADK